MKVSNIISVLAVAATSHATSNSEEPAIVERDPLSLPSVTLPGPLGTITALLPAKTYGSFRPPTATPSAGSSSAATPTALVSTSDDAKAHPNAPNSPDHRGNWGSGFNINTDYNTKWPNTGKTVKYNFNIQNTTLSPDGTPKPMLVVNGQFPGPLVEANWGDWIEVTVTNQLKNNGTGIHWHGFRQVNTNTEDGVGGITECPIAPGHSKVYRFQATSYGTTWYHSHFSAQYGDGVLGPVIVHGPAAYNYDIDLGTVIVDDFYPLTVFQEDWFAHRFGPPQASNYLLNGKNVKPDGSAGTRSQWKFQKGKKHLLRLINTSVDNHFKFQLDGHNFTVISNDFVPINPYSTKELSIAIGQRYDVVVTADQPVSNYYLRAMIAKGCSNNVNDGTLTANGIVSYVGASSALPISNYTTHDNNCFDEPITSLVPIVTQAVDSTGFAAKIGALPVNIQRVTLAGGDNVFLWTLGGISQNIDWNNPTIGQAVTGNDSFASENHVVILPDDNVWTFWVIQNQFFVAHPMHLHGHDFALLGQGPGTFNPATDMTKLNFVNPTRRDVAMLIASGWTVIAFKSDNPGSWLMHCHIAWHVGEGLSLQFLEQPDKIPATYGAKVQSTAFQDNCAAWIKYANGPVAYNKSDSGLKKRFQGDAGRMDVVRHLNSHKHRRSDF